MSEIHGERWKHDGVRVIKGDRLDPNTAQTPGMFRQAAINHARVGAQKIWAGTVRIQPNAKTGAHHHGALESVIYVVRGTRAHALGRAARIRRRGRARRFHLSCRPTCRTRRSTPARTSRSNACWCARDNEAVVVNIDDVEPVEKPEAVYWVDPIHKQP